MPYYRLYFMSPHSGHIEHFSEFDAAGDAEAMARAREHEGQEALELWNERRKVGRIEPNDLASRLLALRREAEAGTPPRRAGTG